MIEQNRGGVLQIDAQCTHTATVAHARAQKLVHAQVLGSNMYACMYIPREHMDCKWLPSDLSVLNSTKAAKEVTTFHHWQAKKEKEYQTLSWLRCDKVNEPGQKYNKLLWWAACRKFEDKIHKVKNFSAAWIAGSLPSQPIINWAMWLTMHRVSNTSCRCLRWVLTELKLWTDL